MGNIAEHQVAAMSAGSRIVDDQSTSDAISEICTETFTKFATNIFYKLVTLFQYSQNFFVAEFLSGMGLSMTTGLVYVPSFGPSQCFLECKKSVKQLSAEFFAQCRGEEFCS